MCDGRLLSQALTNLLQNAVDAIAGREGSALPRGRVVLRLGQEDSGLIAIAVEDNGKGLPGENRERLTEPYFTTPSKGTCLGLAQLRSASCRQSVCLFV